MSDKPFEVYVECEPGMWLLRLNARFSELSKALDEITWYTNHNVKAFLVKRDSSGPAAYAARMK